MSLIKLITKSAKLVGNGVTIALTKFEQEAEKLEIHSSAMLIKTNIKLNRLLWKKSEFKEYKDYLRRISNSWKYYKKQKTQYK